MEWVLRIIKEDLKDTEFITCGVSQIETVTYHFEHEKFINGIKRKKEKK